MVNWLICLFIPIFGMIISGCFGSLFGRNGVIYLTSGCIVISGLISWFCICFVSHGRMLSITLAEWFNVLLTTNWQFSVDGVSSIMLAVVLTVSSIVHLYSINYMKTDPHIVRFFIYLSLFTIFMLMLVTGANIIILFIGWEGVGLCSYLLINFWFTRLQANKAALKAMIVNRVGDISFLAAVSLIILQTGHSSFATIIPSLQIIKLNYNTIFIFVGILVIVAAVGKSAQLGLHTWLPDAMEGPTPVSALIHAATMVTAGVFLTIRMSLWIAESFEVTSLALVFGVATAIFAGTVGLLQYDIKRVVAYSTCSQLGYMIFACGSLVFSVALFHLFNHAFFKALLFLGSGSIIHAMQDEQDLRKYGVLAVLTPYISILFLLASLSLMGFPFLSGFYSKDAILESTISHDGALHLWVYWLGIAAAWLTVAYSFKITCWAFFFNTSNSYKISMQSFHSSSFFEILILVILAILGVTSGYLFKDLFYGFGALYFQNNIFVSNIATYAEFLPFWIKVAPLVGIFLCLLVSWYITVNFKVFSFDNSIKNIQFYTLFNFLSHKWYFNLIQNYFLSRIVLICGYESFWVWDRWILEQINFNN